MNAEKMIQYFLDEFPEHAEMYREHMQEYGVLLQHVFYADAINVPLFALLNANQNAALIEKYCAVIAYMQQNGDETVQNVVDVTVLERLSDDPEVWQNFGKHISGSFKDWVNREWVTENQKWLDIEPLK